MNTMVLLPSWKEEPASPPSSGDEAALDVLYEQLDHHNTIYQSSVWESFDVKLEDLALCESKAEVASHILENLENLVNLDELIKEEPYLLDEKILPMLEAVEAPRAVPVPLQHAFKEDPATTTTTEYLLNDIENVYNSVALTPPQSPPAKTPPMLATLEPIGQMPSQHLYPAAPQVPSPGKLIVQEFCHLPMLNEVECNVFPSQQSPDIALELAVVDELVRSRVEDMQWSSSQSSSSSSPRSPESSSCSNFGDCSSDDPEWVPEAVAGEAASEPGAKPSRKRSRAYSKTPVEEKKVRKKEQNKNAATRYRLKKKAEVEEILTEEKILLNKKNELDTKLTDLQREIKYLKGLMRDLFKAKGLIN